MNAFRATIKQLRTQVAEAEGLKPLIELLGEGDDIERAIGQRRDELTRLEADIIKASATVKTNEGEASQIVADARAEAVKIVAAAETEKEAAISAAVLKALGETGDVAAAILSDAKLNAGKEENAARERLAAIEAEVETAKVEKAGVEAEVADLVKKRDQVQADIAAIKRNLG